jgi:hypothetical protein
MLDGRFGVRAPPQLGYGAGMIGINRNDSLSPPQ